MHISCDILWWTNCTLHVKSTTNACKYLNISICNALKSIWCSYLYFDESFCFRLYILNLNCDNSTENLNTNNFCSFVIINTFQIYIRKSKLQFNDLILFWKVSYCFLKQFCYSWINYKHWTISHYIFLVFKPKVLLYVYACITWALLVHSIYEIYDQILDSFEPKSCFLLNVDIYEFHFSVFIIFKLRPDTHFDWKVHKLI